VQTKAAPFEKSTSRLPGDAISTVRLIAVQLSATRICSARTRRETQKIEKRPEDGLPGGLAPNDPARN
jgi:hypothetical protein